MLRCFGDKAKARTDIRSRIRGGGIRMRVEETVTRTSMAAESQNMKLNKRYIDVI